MDMTRVRSLISLTDLSPGEIGEVLDRSASLKWGSASSSLSGRTVVMLFEKPSLRTRLSFEVAVSRLGGRALYFSPQEVGLGVREPVEDVARVISRMADAAVIRTFEQSILERMDRVSSISIINALTNEEHPCQALADLLTIREAFGGFDGVRIAFVGDGNNVAASLAFGVASVGGTLTVASPEGYALPEEVLRQAAAISVHTGGQVRQVVSPREAVTEADVVYTDVWASMGQEGEADLRRQAFDGYQVNPGLLELASAKVRFMHDLPAHPGEEVSEGLLEDPRAIVFDQAENRLHAQAGLLDFLFSRSRRP